MNLQIILSYNVSLRTPLISYLKTRFTEYPPLATHVVVLTKQISSTFLKILYKSNLKIRDSIKLGSENKFFLENYSRFCNLILDSEIKNKNNLENDN